MHTKRLLVLLPAFVLLFAVSCNKLGKPDDAAITADIKAKMFCDPLPKAANVEVSAHGGEVTLSGQVPDDSARLAAYKIASESKGVSKVNDQMSVQSAQSAAAQPATDPVPEPAATTGPPEKVPPKRKPSYAKPSKSPPTATETVAPAPADATPASAASAPPEKPAAPTPLRRLSPEQLLSLRAQPLQSA